MITIPDPETLKASAITFLRETGADENADLLSRCRIEVAKQGQRYTGSTQVGLNITLRCRAADLARFKDEDGLWDLPSASHFAVQNAIGAVLPAQLKVHDLSARSLLVNRREFDKTELERLIESQIDLMIAVSTGGPRIETKNGEYRERRERIREMLLKLEQSDPNPFEDLWAWYGRWSSGDLPSYQSRRDYVRGLYRPLLEDIAGASSRNASEPSRASTGWEKVDRTVDKIVAALGRAGDEEEHRSVGLLCRECIISLAQAAFDRERHHSGDGAKVSDTDAYRMLEAYFGSEFAGSEYEALRRHAKASLNLANSLQHKRTAGYKDAALCAEATRTVVNIVAITSGRR